MIWFTSDLHLGHARILEFEPARRVLGDTIHEMNEQLIARYNSRVQPDDLCYVLGDFGLSAVANIRDWLSRMNGTKVLILGNHDQSQSRMLKFGFDAVLYRAELRIAGQDVVMSHYPYRYGWWKWVLGGCKRDDAKCAGKRPKDEGKYLLHGHIHANGHHNMRWRVKDRQINVGVDVNNFYPVSLSDIELIIQRGVK